MADAKIKYEAPLTITVGQIQFIEACHPPLVAGEYKVAMDHVIKESKSATELWNSEPYKAELTFAVDAPRFTLDPTTIHSVFPPLNSTGRFNNVLPHVVFTRRTLPWERTLDGAAPEFGKPFLPWIALLLLEEEELGSDVRSLPIAAPAGPDTSSLLFPRPDENLIVPDLGQGNQEKWTKESWQYTGKSCLTLDLPAELFKAVAPSDKDLPFLAHVRQVDTGNKEVLGINDKGWFSLVMGNRVPQPRTTYRAFLVSLEGLQKCLKSDWIPQPAQHVRLAVLASWGFTCDGKNDFKQYMKKLNFESPDSWLHLPHERESDEGADPANVVHGAYSRGYTAFNHVMRQGETTVSWYRGPLVPLNYNKPQQIQDLVSCADELLRYDPATGLFDATYAAAWQLGRLLALQNQSFALALNRRRRAERTANETDMRARETSELKRRLASPGADSIEDSLLDSLANGSGDTLLKSVPKDSK